MKDYRKFYIDGKWVDPASSHDSTVVNFTVINPANEEPIATISLGGAADVERAVAAAKRAFESYSETTAEQRLALLRRVIDIYKSKLEEMAATISPGDGRTNLAGTKSAGAGRTGAFVGDREGAGAFQVRRTKGLDADAKRASWSVWLDHSLELAHEPGGGEGGTGTGGGMHDGAEAQ